LSASGQTKHDSLYTVLLNASKPIEKGIALEKLFKHTHLGDTDTSAYYLNQLEQIAFDHDIDTLKLLSYLHGSNLGLTVSEYARTDSLLTILSQELDSTIDTKLLGEFYDLRGTYYYLQNEYDLSSKYYYKSEKTFTSIGDNIGIANAMMHIGNTLRKISNHDKAFDYYKKAEIILLKNSPNHPKLGIIYNGLATIHYYKTEYDEAISYFKSFAQIAEKHNSLKDIITGNNNIASSLIKAKRPAEAKPYLDKAISIGEKKKSMRPYISALSTKGQYFIALKDYKSAITSLDLALEENRNSKAKSHPDQIYRNISEAYKLDGDYQNAMHYHVKYKNYTDSLLNLRKIKEIEKLDILYNTAKKDSELSKKQLLIQKQNSQKNILLLSSFLLGLLAISIFWFMKNSMKKNRKLAQQDSQIKSQKINQLEKEKKLLAMNAMLEGQEAERMRIAKDLHDGLGGLLSTVKARLTNINAEVRKIESYNIYEKTTNMVDEACDEVRRISHNLLPGALRLDGLQTAIEQLGEDLSKSHPFEVSVEIIELEEKLDETKEIFIFRIIQEAMNNIIKHADPKQVLIQLSATDQEYHIIIEDDGLGFDTSTDNTGLGLKSIKSRVEHLQGKIDIRSQRNQGTTISIHIPKTKA